MHDLPVGAHLLFSCPATAVVRRERRFAHLSFTALQDLIAVLMLTGGTICVQVHENADAAPVAAARQQPRQF
jgi:hypothetical protein